MAATQFRRLMASSLAGSVRQFFVELEGGAAGKVDLWQAVIVGWVVRASWHSIKEKIGGFPGCNGIQPSVEKS